MSLYVFAGAPGTRYPYLRTRHGVAPFSELQPGDVVDFGEHEPPDDELWTTAKSTRIANRRPDNAPSLAVEFSNSTRPPHDAPTDGPARAKPTKKGADT